MIVTHRVDAVLAMDIPERKNPVADLVPRGDCIMLAAREKAGKGLIALDLAFCIATGTPFIGRSTLRGPVIYLALEESRRTIRDRLRARAGGREDAPVYVAFLDGSDNQTFRLDDDGISIEALDEAIRKHMPVLVILDVLREAHDGRENESDDMALLLRPLRQLAHQHNTTILVTHHASKGGGYRGSTAIAASFDDVIEFVREDLSDDTQIRGLLTARGRDLPKVAQRIEFEPVSFRWKAIAGTPAVSQPTSAREKVFAVLNGTDEWLTAEEIADRTEGITRKTVQNILTSLLAERYKQILARGTGTKGEPRQYHGIHKRPDPDPPESGNDPGPMEDGQRASPNGSTTEIGNVDLAHCQQCGGDLPDDQGAICPDCGDEDADMRAEAWDEMSDFRRVS